jgi:hypothetical protein
MLSAVISGFAYLRLTLLSVRPLGAPSDVDELDVDTAVSQPMHHLGATLLLEEEAPVDVAVRHVPSSPVALSGVAIATAFTVVFGLIPGPILSLAHAATLSLLG